MQECEVIIKVKQNKESYPLFKIIERKNLNIINIDSLSSKNRYIHFLLKALTLNSSFIQDIVSIELGNKDMENEYGINFSYTIIQHKKRDIRKIRVNEETSGDYMI